MHEPAPGKLYLALERKSPETSDQECEPATPCYVLGVLAKFEGMEEDPTTEGEILLTSANYCCDEPEVEIYLDLPTPSYLVENLLYLSWFHPVQSLLCPLLVLPSTHSPVSPEFPASVPLPPPLSILDRSSALLLLVPLTPLPFPLSKSASLSASSPLSPVSPSAPP